MLSLRNVDIQYVKGIGPARASLLAAELGLRTAYDLLRHYPTGYVDRSTFATARAVFDSLCRGGELPSIQLKGHFISFTVQGEGAKMRLVGLFTDGTATMECVWFRGVRAMRSRLKTGVEYVVFGKPSLFSHILQMSHPEVDSPQAIAGDMQAHGIYPLTEKLRQRGVNSRVLHAAVRSLLDSRKHLEDFIPKEVLAAENLPDIDSAIREVHMPGGTDTLATARDRLKFEELFLIQTDMLRRSRRRKAQSEGLLMPRVGRWFNGFYHDFLPFELTGAQKRVIKEVRADMMSGRQMNRLVQGDVGSGKTLVAFMCMLLALDNGYQACLMAPTEILAGQHAATLRDMASAMGLGLALLTGSTPAGERRRIAQGLTDGSIHIIVGTHALLEDTVTFRNLGLAVIDEQHRFGVAQRARLWTKNDVPPHVLVMTATPIPRTLAMTVYGDLDVSVIDELPPGRKPIATALRSENDLPAIYRALHAEIAAGRRIYVVFPLIDENEKLDLASLEEGYKEIVAAFPEAGVAFVHGRMKPAEKDWQMKRFAEGEAAILVATTVIEVGVNVPEATVMIIRNAERFGLSQLHQLRGRVGRGADRSYCILVAKQKLSADTRRRLEVMTATTDGFRIAEADMEMRGPGDIEGTAQSGMPFELHIANLALDGVMIGRARAAAAALLDADPELTATANRRLAVALRSLAVKGIDWSKIS